MTVRDFEWLPMAKSEIRISKSETNSKSEIRMTKTGNVRIGDENPPCPVNHHAARLERGENSVAEQLAASGAVLVGETAAARIERAHVGRPGLPAATAALVVMDRRE